MKQLGVIRKLLRSADEVICATDAGREGELIFRYIQELTGCVGKPARRLWLNSLTESAIREAFGRLRPLSGFDALYAAARCRSEADWVVGLNATRYYTVRYRSSGHLWSVGRVQTPVLAMIVCRDDEIRTFTPEPFWELLTRYRAVTFKLAGTASPARTRRRGSSSGSASSRSRSSGSTASWRGYRPPSSTT
jgi:DNA topoisomerase-3